MFANKNFLIGLHLLVTYHVAKTFVILSANVEDVKKIAKEFTGPLTDEIVDLILKATKNYTFMTSHEIEAKNHKYLNSPEKYKKKKILKDNDGLIQLEKYDIGEKKVKDIPDYLNYISPKVHTYAKENTEAQITYSTPKRYNIMFLSAHAPPPIPKDSDKILNEPKKHKDDQKALKVLITSSKILNEPSKYQNKHVNHITSPQIPIISSKILSKFKKYYDDDQNYNNPPEVPKVKLKAQKKYGHDDRNRVALRKIPKISNKRINTAKKYTDDKNKISIEEKTFQKRDTSTKIIEFNSDSEEETNIHQYEPSSMKKKETTTTLDAKISMQKKTKRYKTVQKTAPTKETNDETTIDLELKKFENEVRSYLTSKLYPKAASETPQTQNTQSTDSHIERNVEQIRSKSKSHKTQTKRNEITKGTTLNLGKLVEKVKRLDQVAQNFLNTSRIILSTRPTPAYPKQDYNEYKIPNSEYKLSYDPNQKANVEEYGQMVAGFFKRNQMNIESPENQLSEVIQKIIETRLNDKLLKTTVYSSRRQHMSSRPTEAHNTQGVLTNSEEETIFKILKAMIDNRKIKELKSSQYVKENSHEIEKRYTINAFNIQHLSPEEKMADVVHKMVDSSLRMQFEKPQMPASALAEILKKNNYENDKASSNEKTVSEMIEKLIEKKIQEYAQITTNTLASKQFHAETRPNPYSKDKRWPNLRPSYKNARAQSMTKNESPPTGYETLTRSTEVEKIPKVDFLIPYAEYDRTRSTTATNRTDESPFRIKQSTKRHHNQHTSTLPAEVSEIKISHGRQGPISIVIEDKESNEKQRPLPQTLLLQKPQITNRTDPKVIVVDSRHIQHASTKASYWQEEIKTELVKKILKEEETTKPTDKTTKNHKISRSNDEIQANDGDLYSNKIPNVQLIFLNVPQLEIKKNKNNMLREKKETNEENKKEGDKILEKEGKKLKEKRREQKEEKRQEEEKRREEENRNAEEIREQRQKTTEQDKTREEEKRIQEESKQEEQKRVKKIKKQEEENRKEKKKTEEEKKREKERIEEERRQEEQKKIEEEIRREEENQKEKKRMEKEKSREERKREEKRMEEERKQEERNITEEENRKEEKRKQEKRIEEEKYELEDKLRQGIKIIEEEKRKEDEKRKQEKILGEEKKQKEERRQEEEKRKEEELRQEDEKRIKEERRREEEEKKEEKRQKEEKRREEEKIKLIEQRIREKIHEENRLEEKRKQEEEKRREEIRKNEERQESEKKALREKIINEIREKEIFDKKIEKNMEIKKQEKQKADAIAAMQVAENKRKEVEKELINEKLLSMQEQFKKDLEKALQDTLNNKIKITQSTTSTTLNYWEQQWQQDQEIKLREEYNKYMELHDAGTGLSDKKINYWNDQWRTDLEKKLREQQKHDKIKTTHNNNWLNTELPTTLYNLEEEGTLKETASMELVTNQPVSVPITDEFGNILESQDNLETEPSNPFVHNWRSRNKLRQTLKESEKSIPKKIVIRAYHINKPNGFDTRRDDVDSDTIHIIPDIRKRDSVIMDRVQDRSSNSDTVILEKKNNRRKSKRSQSKKVSVIQDKAKKKMKKNIFVDKTSDIMKSDNEKSLENYKAELGEIKESPENILRQRNYKIRKSKHEKLKRDKFEPKVDYNLEEKVQNKKKNINKEDENIKLEKRKKNNKAGNTKNDKVKKKLNEETENLNFFLQDSKKYKNIGSEKKKGERKMKLRKKLKAENQDIKEKEHKKQKTQDRKGNTTTVKVDENHEDEVDKKHKKPEKSRGTKHRKGIKHNAQYDDDERNQENKEQENNVRKTKKKKEEKDTSQMYENKEGKKQNHTNDQKDIETHKDDDESIEKVTKDKNEEKKSRNGKDQEKLMLREDEDIFNEEVIVGKKVEKKGKRKKKTRVKEREKSIFKQEKNDTIKTNKTDEDSSGKEFDFQLMIGEKTT